MKESTTYQAILQEGIQEGLVKGAVKEARKLLVRRGSKKLGRPGAATRAALDKIADLDRLEALVEQLGMVKNWQALLAKAQAERE
jgi:hypothetical protein